MRTEKQLGSINVKFEERGVELDILEKIKAEKKIKNHRKEFLLSYRLRVKTPYS